eukprot:s6875_g1.t1
MGELPIGEEEYVVLAERALKIWYAAILAQPMKKQNYSPAEELDLVWHCHILDMRNYADFQQQLGTEIGHVPCGDEETNDLAQTESVLNAVSFLLDAKLLNTFFSERGMHKMKEAWRRAGALLPEVATVDALQGDEREVVIFSATRSNDTGAIGFLSDPRRANVLLTRARRALFVVGDPRLGLSAATPLGAHGWRRCPRRALILNPIDPYTLAVRAEAQMCIGNLDEAIADCDQALQLSPSLEYAVMIRERACNLEAQEQQAAFRFSE